jgi:hypothetical protein
MYNKSIIAGAVSRIKADFGGIFERQGLRALCRQNGCKWRERILPPARTIELLLMQVLYGNTAINHLRHIAGMNFSASAFCQARARVPLGVLQKILTKLGRKFIKNNDDRWLGHRTFLIDGSSFSTPDTETLGKHFKYPYGQKVGCGFPVGHLLALFHAKTGMIQSLIPAQCHTHDMSQVSQIHPDLSKGDVLVGDRAFCSFAHVALLLKHKLHAVLRMHQRIKVSNLRCIKRITKNDKIVELRKPKYPGSWMSQDEFNLLPQTITVRSISYKINKPGFRTKEVSILTSLLDNVLYPVAEIQKLYRSRWEIETNFNHLKTTMGMDTLRCKNVAGVLKEIYAFAIVYNLVRIVMYQAAKKQNVSTNRISFIDALRWLCHCAPAQSLNLIVNPVRNDRNFPRAIKRRPKQYDRLNKPRSHYKIALEGLS